MAEEALNESYPWKWRVSQALTNPDPTLFDFWDCGVQGSLAAILPALGFGVLGEIP